MVSSSVEQMRSTCQPLQNGALVCPKLPKLTRKHRRLLSSNCSRAVLAVCRLRDQHNLPNCAPNTVPRLPQQHTGGRPKHHHIGLQCERRAPISLNFTDVPGCAVVVYSLHRISVILVIVTTADINHILSSPRETQKSRVLRFPTRSPEVPKCGVVVHLNDVHGSL